MCVCVCVCDCVALVGVSMYALLSLACFLVFVSAEASCRSLWFCESAGLSVLHTQSILLQCHQLSHKA